ncbi:unnamed protein product [Caenorhabditis angaria]|uniref:Uncharacterized protein n=1 Tax=Caenorhabditis angaria TaxID=860376 RepID=A0A9P1I3Z3_9PELO|nr:unnamed protein product [Caenorhabditis angaria]
MYSENVAVTKRHTDRAKFSSMWEQIENLGSKTTPHLCQRLGVKAVGDIKNGFFFFELSSASSLFSLFSLSFNNGVAVSRRCVISKLRSRHRRIEEISRENNGTSEIVRICQWFRIDRSVVLQTHNLDMEIAP